MRQHPGKKMENASVMQEKFQESVLSQRPRKEAIWKKKHDNPTHKPWTAEQNEDWEMTSKDSLGSLARVGSRGRVE